MSRSELVKFRVTPAEKAYLVTQAGGSRQLSSFLRDLSLTDYVESTPVTDQALPVPNKAIPARQMRAPSKKKARETEAAAVAAQRTEAASSTCPRWMHHRSGTYCGSCKTVPK